MAEDPRGKAEKLCAPFCNPVGIYLLFEQAGPSVFQRPQFGTSYPERKKILRGRLQGRRSWRRRMIELLQPLPPPGELRRSECRLGCTSNDITHRRIDLEKRFESRPDVIRNLPQNERPISAYRRGQLVVSDSRRPSRPRQRPTP